MNDIEYLKYCQSRNDYLIAVQPFLEMLCDLELRMPRRMILKPDGSLEIPEDQGWPQWAVDHKAKIEMLINDLQERYFPSDPLFTAHRK